MARTETNQQKKPTIVVDTNCLLQLCSEISPHLMQGPSNGKRYLSMLQLLAENGYQVVIPEMVAFQAACVLANGADTTRFFRKKPEFVYANDALIPFLRDVAGGKLYPNIKIVETGPQHVPAYLQNLKEIIAKYPQTLVDARNGSIKAGEGLAKHHIAQDIITLDSYYGSRKSWGNDAVLDYLKQHQGEQIVFLSDNQALRDEAAQLSGCSVLKIPAFIYMFAGAKLHTNLGIMGSVTPEELYNDSIRDAALKFIGYDSEKAFKPDDSESYLRSVCQHSFYSEIKFLKYNLDRKNPEPAHIDPELAEMGKSQMEKWRLRDAKRLALQAPASPLARG